MNATLHALTALDDKPRTRVDGEHTITLNDCDWKIRFDYRIDKAGTPRTTYYSDGLQEDEGEATEISIVGATLISKHHEELVLPLSMIPGDVLSDYEQGIAQIIDEDEL